MTIKKRFFRKDDQHFFLFGPRGTGKSTWLREIYPEAGWIDMLDAAEYRAYLARPERLQEFAEAHSKRKTIVIDEIQRVPELLPMVHKLIEDMPDVCFILTGSSARKLKRSGVDLLAGRAVVKKMHPFIASEMGDDFHLEESLELGMLPLVRYAKNPKDVLQGYITLYLQQEVQAEGLVRQVDSFARFLETISFSQGAPLNNAEIARECEAKRTTVSGFVEILEDLLIAKRVPVFSRRAKRAVISHSKFYFFDCGVYRSLRPSGPLDKPEESAGPALEGLVFQHLQAWIDYSGLHLKIYFWRTRAGSEVDFVLYGNDGFWVIEVKNARTVRQKDLRPLKTFIEDYPECEALLLYRGDQMFKRDNVLCLPVEEFLRQLRPGQKLY